jgi:hypothetical protein
MLRMAGNDIVPSLNDEDYATLFEEAIQAKMVPYDVRVWSRYLFDKCNAVQIDYLVNLFWNLLNIEKVDAQEIGTWCLQGVFYDEAVKRTALSPLWSFLTYQHATFNASPNNYPYITICTDSALQKRWFEQSNYCFASTECQVKGLASKRYCYFVMGMMVWEIKPEKKWASDPDHGNFDAYFALGYDKVASNKRLRAQDLLKAYSAAFPQHRGVSHISFEMFNDGTTARTRILEQIDRDPSLRVSQSLLRSITSFFENIPQQKEDSVWSLKHVLQSEITWEKMLKLSLFKDAAQDYGYTTLRQYENTEIDIDEVVNNLRDAYVVALNHDPLRLHRACKNFGLQEYVPLVCRANGLVLHPKTVEVLQNADGNNIQPLSTDELYKTREALH